MEARGSSHAVDEQPAASKFCFEDGRLDLRNGIPQSQRWFLLIVSARLMNLMTRCYEGDGL